MATPTHLAGVILAAGESSRLGQPKQLVRWHGKSLVQHAVDIAATFCNSGVLVVTGAGNDAIQADLQGRSASLVYNPDWAEGVAGSLRTGLNAVSTECDAVLVMLCDQPLISISDIRQLVAAWTECPDRAVAAAYNDVLGVPAIFPRAVLPELRNLAGHQGASAWLRQQPGQPSVGMPSAAFDVDTEADLRALQEQDKQS